MTFRVVCKKGTSTLTKQVGLKAHLSFETILPFHKNKPNKTKNTPPKTTLSGQVLIFHFINTTVNSVTREPQPGVKHQHGGAAETLVLSTADLTQR